MQKVALLVQQYQATTAIETVDLALAFGLLEIEVHVCLCGTAQAHLVPASTEIKGRWQTLLDFCPARVYWSPDPDASECVITAASTWQILAETITHAKLQEILAQCEHVVFA